MKHRALPNMNGFLRPIEKNNRVGFQSTNSFNKRCMGCFVISKGQVPRVFDNHQGICKDYLGTLFIRI